jgi:hypothetical protein
MKQIELTSKLVLAIIGLTSVSAILVPTYAVPQITSADIVNETIQSVDIKNGQVNTVDLANDAVKPNVHRVQGDGVTLAADESGSDTADCPAGETLTGGGFEFTGAASEERIESNFPQDADTWFVEGENEGVGVPDAVLTAYALCIGPSP